MNMGHIAGFGIFAMNLPQPRVIYIDDGSSDAYNQSCNSTFI